MNDNVVKLNPKPRIKMLPVLEQDFDTHLADGLKLIEPAVARQIQNVSLSDVEEDIRAGGAVMWLVYLEDTLVAAITTCVVKHPQRKNLKIEFMGGTKMRQWMNEAIALLANLAKDAGLSALEADGRKGFEKYVDNSPFREIYSHYEMEIS
jgi:hypothetical protein